MGKSVNSVIFSVISFIGTLTINANAQSLESSELYRQAQQALKNKDLPAFNQLKTQLTDYPLTIYLDYQIELKELLTLEGEEFISRLNHYKNTPLHASIYRKYLLNAGRKQRWRDFLVVSPDKPNSTQLQCYYYRAKYTQTSEDKNTAIMGAKQLWLQGHSQPKECNPLFKKWQKDGHLTDELIWQRMLLTFEKNQKKLLKILAKKTYKDRQSSKLLLRVYNSPRKLADIDLNQAISEKTKQIIVVGLKKLARYDLHLALKLYSDYVQQDILTDEQSKDINRYIVYRVLYKNDNRLIEHVDNMLPIIRSDKLTEMRLRWALKENDMQALMKTLPLLSEETKQKPRWQYWYAMVNQDPSEPVLTQLSEQRNFYGFIAATYLNKPINIAAKSYVLDKNLVPQLKANTTYKRVKEFININNIISARIEWRFLLKQLDKPTQIQYSLIAKENQWYSLGVQSTIHGKQWNHIAVRFPFAHDAEFIDASQTYGVNVDEIMAIARRESAFHPYATSPVGAKGLMQLMPKTAKQTAKKNKLNYVNSRNLYDPQLNIQLGSAYYAELLTKFNNNRVLATAAYNAGPHRVKNWLSKTKKPLDVMAFIESIPFRETREYVQAVFAYRLIYEVQRGKNNQPVFTKQEQNYLY